jgi:putative spermidine/putrescine transport system substrate-binding protein
MTSAKREPDVGGISRRTLLKGAGALAGVAVGGGALASCSSSTTKSSAKSEAKVVWVGDYGGTFQAAKTKGIYDPFTKETGINVEVIANPTEAMVKAMVDAGDVTMDMSPLGITAVLELGEKYFQPLPDYVFKVPGLDSSLMYPPWSATVEVFAETFGWNTQTAKKPPPSNWAEFWDTTKFPGPRAVSGEDATPPLEQALLAAGVPMDKLYPLDVDLAFSMLEEIKPHVVTWYSTDAQPPELLSTKQVTYSQILDGRAYDAIQQGAHIGYTLNQAMMDVGSFVVTAGAPHAKNAFELIAFAMRADVQAATWSLIPYGPSNLDALKLMKPSYAAILPTAAANRKNEFMIDQYWWGANGVEMAKRFESFLVSLGVSVMQSRLASAGPPGPARGGRCR